MKYAALVFLTALGLTSCTTLMEDRKHLMCHDDTGTLQVNEHVKRRAVGECYRDTFGYCVDIEANDCKVENIN